MSSVHCAGGALSSPIISTTSPRCSFQSAAFVNVPPQKFSMWRISLDLVHSHQWNTNSVKKPKKVVPTPRTLYMWNWFCTYWLKKGTWIEKTVGGLGFMKALFLNDILELTLWDDQYSQAESDIAGLSCPRLKQWGVVWHIIRKRTYLFGWSVLNNSSGSLVHSRA